jgi:hypothetical protein
MSCRRLGQRESRNTCGCLAAVADAVFYPKTKSLFQHKTGKKQAAERGEEHLASIRGDGTRVASGQGRGRLGTPTAARGDGRCVVLTLKQISRFQHVTEKYKTQDGGEGTLRRCDGMGRDLPAVRPAGGPKHRRLLAEVANAMS